MSRLHVKYLLVGGGAASSSAAIAIRRRDSQGSILVVGQEINRPYHRAPLAGPYLRGQLPRQSLYAADVSWYSQNAVALRTGQRAVLLDTPRRLVTLDNGEEISFDRLLIATGASPNHLKIPGADIPGVYYLHTLEDADRLRHAVDQARHMGRPHHAQQLEKTPDDAAIHPAMQQPPSPAGARRPVARGRAVVIGADRLGVELAASLSQMGIEVELLATAGLPWSGFAGENIGRFVASYLQTRGVRVHSGCSPIRLEGDGRVQRVVISSSPTADGGPAALDCDFVAVSLGTQAHKELLRGTSITAENAILVDEYCRTNANGIYAAGDCAAIFDVLFGKHNLCLRWDSAAVTGEIAGENMASVIDTGDDPNPPGPIPTPPAKFSGAGFFGSEFSDLSLHAWGESRFVARRLLRGPANPGPANLPTGPLLEFGIDSEGRIAQMIILQSTTAANAATQHDIHSTLQQLVQQRVNISGREEQIKDPLFALKDLLPD